MPKRAAADDDIKPRSGRVTYDPATQKEAALLIHLHAHAIGHDFDKKKTAEVIVKHGNGTFGPEYGARPCRFAPAGALQLWKKNGFEQYGGYEKLRVKVLTKHAHVFETLCAPSMTQARALRTAHRRARRPLRRGAPPQPMRRARTSADDAAPCVLRRKNSSRTR